LYRFATSRNAGPTILLSTPWHDRHALRRANSAGCIATGCVDSAVFARAGPTSRFCCARSPWLSRAYSGNADASFTSVAQSFMHAVFTTSGLPFTSQRPWLRVMPLRFGSLACTSAMLRSDRTKSPGSTSPRLRR
jgi:hypothetical protein